MKQKTYAINPTKIGNQQGFRLPRTFYRDNPHLAETGGEIEVLNEDTLLIRFHPNNKIDNDEDEGLMMSLFLDFLIKDAMKNPEQLIPYTEEMSQEIEEFFSRCLIKLN